MIDLEWPQWVLVTCAVASIACTVVGAVMAGIAFNRFSKHFQRTKGDAESMLDLQRAEAALARINAAIDDLAPLLARAQRALLTLKAAGVALRLLVSGR